MSSRSASSSSSRSEPSRPNSTSPKVPRRVGGASGRPRVGANGTSSRAGDGRGKAISRSSSSASQLEEEGGRAGPHKISSPSGGRPASREGGAKTREGGVKSGVTGEGEKRSSVKSSPLAKRKLGVGQNNPSRRVSSEGKINPTHTSAPRANKLPRPSSGSSIREKEEQKSSSLSSAKKKVSTGKPPSGATTSRSGVRQPATGATVNGGRNSVKQGGASNGTSSGAKATPESSTGGERARTQSTSSGGSTPGKKTVVKKSMLVGEGGRESPAERRPARSLGNSPATVRRAESVRRSAESSPGVVRRSSTLRRISSSGSIPVRPGRDRRAESDSPKKGGTVEKRVANGGPKIEKKAGSKTINPATSRRGTGESATRRGTAETKRNGEPATKRESSTKKGLAEPATKRGSVGEKKAGGGVGTSKQSATGGSLVNPANRRSIRSRSEVTLGAPRKTDTQSIGRKISASSAAGRGSPNTLAGKAIILDHTHLKDEEKLQSAFKLLKPGAAGGGGLKKTNRGPVIRTMGMVSSTGRSSPTARGRGSGGRGTVSAVKSGITRTGSGSSIPSRTSPRPGPSSRGRLRSSDDVLKADRSSPGVRVTSPLSTATVAPPREKEIEGERDGKTVDSNKPSKMEEKKDIEEEKKEKRNEEKEKEEQKKEKEKEERSEEKEKEEQKKEKEKEEQKKEVKEKQVEAMRTRPSCRNTKVKSKIASWKKMEEEARKSDPPSMSPVPPSLRSPLTTSPLSHTSPRYSPHSEQQKRSESPTVITSSGTPVKSRIALWTEKEKESHNVRSSLSPQRSPTHSPPHTSPPHTSPPQTSPPHTSPRGLRRQSPVDKRRRSPATSATSSREGSVESNTQSLSVGASPSRQLPSITVREEGTGQQDTAHKEKDDDVYDDIESSPQRKVQEMVTRAEDTIAEEAIYSTIPEVYENFPRGNHLRDEENAPVLPPCSNLTKPEEGDMKVVDIEDEEKSSGTEYPRMAPGYTEIDIMDASKSAGTSVQSSLPAELTPKNKKRWLRSPRFGRRKSTPDDRDTPSEGVAGEKEEKRNEGLMKKIARIGSRSGKEKLAVKQRSGEDSDSSSSLEDSRGDTKTRSSSDFGSDLKPEVIPRSNSYSPAGRSHTGPSGNTVDPVGGASEQLQATPRTVQHYRKSAPPTQWAGGANPLSSDIRSMIDNLGEGLEFCEMYSKKVTSLPGPREKVSCGSAPGGLRLPVPFDLNHGSSHPNLVSVGFKVPPESSLVPNGVGVRSEGVSESSTGSEGEGSSEKEEEGDIVYPVESSLDRGQHTRYDIKKRKLSESSEKTHAVEPSQDNLVVTSLMYADAVWDRVGMENDELSFRVGDVIEILDMTDDTWWQGSVKESSGWFPSAFVRLRIAQEEEDEDMYALPPDAREIVGGTLPRVTTMPAGDPTYSSATYGRSSNSKRRMTIRRKDSCPSMPRKLTPSEVRSKVVEEILNTERDYVKHLEDIIEGFLKKCRVNTKLFDQEKVETIFSNLERLYQFQLEFLGQLEARISQSLEDSQIGEVFVACRKGFEVYSEYCNNHPHAVNEMCQLQKKEQYAFFFESCRLLRNLQNIPLEGFLLLPVQKICKYPLQLSELLKYTGEDHPDRAAVERAVVAMRQVATHINEGKRRLENIGRIGMWQESIDGWKGPDIVETSTEMIHSSELHKISKGHSQERHFFLFDNQLIYCKKDAIGGRLSYKGRLSMEKCHITDLPDGQETHNGVPVRNAWKMDNEAKGKDYIIFAKSPEIKSKWMDAFRREQERVAQDRATDFSVSLKMKRAAASLCSTPSTAVSAAKRRKSFNKKQVLKVHGLTESVDSAMRMRVEGSPARERKGKFSRMKQIF